MKDDEAFEALWTAQFKQVARTVYLISGDTEESLDLAQEAFARAFERWRTVGRLERPEAWVHKVATNLALSKRRRRSPSLHIVAEVPEPNPPRDDVMRALRNLSPAQRAVVVMRFYLDWSINDVAEALGKRPGTVQALTHQGIERLRQLLPKEEHDG